MDRPAKRGIRRRVRPPKGTKAGRPAQRGTLDEAADRSAVPLQLQRPDVSTLLDLQRAAGNAAVTGLVSAHRVSLQRAPQDDEDRPPPTDKTAAELGIKPGSPLDTPLGRATRAEQLRRAAERPVDQISVVGGTQTSRARTADATADARARARAADYAPIYAQWAALGPAGRAEQFQQIINAHLQREGVPPVTVKFGDKPPGAAETRAGLWAMSLSKAALDNATPTIDQFAELVDNAVHETHHVVTTFRGVRVALDTKGGYNPKTPIPDRVREQAEAANRQRRPSSEFDEVTRKEALEIYQASVEPLPTAAGPVPARSTDAVARDAVLARKEAAEKVMANARALLAFNEDELRKDPTDAGLQRNVTDSKAALRRAEQAYIEPHNAYLSLTEESASWRVGAAARTAVRERLELEAQVKQARDDATEAGSRRAEALAKKDSRTARAEMLNASAALRRAVKLQTTINNLTSDEVRLVEGRRIVREIPLTKAQITNAPKPPVLDDLLAPGEGPNARPRPSAASPYPTSSVTPGSGAGAGKQIPKVDPAKATAVVTPGPTPSGVKRNVVAAPGGGIGTEWVAEHETTSGGTTRKTERGGGFTVGGDTVVGAGGRSVTTTTTGDVSTTVSSSGGVGLTKDGALEAKGGRTTEIVHGLDANGKPITSTRSTTGGMTLGDQGLGVNAGSSTTSKGGTTRSTTGGVTYDDKGNATAEAGYGMAGKSGTGIKTTFRAGHQVDAGDPVEVSKGVFEVRYTVTDSKAVGLGGSASRTPSGPSLGATAGTSSASSVIGVRRFTSKAEATTFKDNAAMMIELGGAAGAPTTSAAALKIPVGETRGSGDMEGSNWGVSGSYGATIGYGEQKSTSHQLTVRRLSESLFDVTAVVSRDKVKDWSISGGITNTKGTSASSALSITFRFDLSGQTGRDAFELYLRTGIPMPSAGRPVSVTESKAEEEHDRVQVGPLGSAQWSGRTTESVTTTDAGVSKTFGGEQAHDQTPGRVGRWLGEDELHSSAVLSSRQENGKEAGYTAEIRVKSDSGEYNREKFGEIFMGAQQGKADAKPSGEWTLTAEIDKRVVHELERNSSRFRNAKTRDDKMRVLSQLFKENGAGAAGGLVRSGGKFALAWALELKGDPNFPGVAGQQALKAQQKGLDEVLRTTPDSADAVVREAKEAVDKLQLRRQAVARPDKYTDLPAELRQQQLTLIDNHITAFTALHQRGLRLAVKTDRKAGADATRAKLADQRNYNELPADQREADQLRDRSSTLQDSIDTTRKQIFEASKAVHKGSLNVVTGINSRQLGEQTTSWKSHIAIAYELDRRQSALKIKADGLLESWNSATEPRARIERLRALVACLDDRLKLMILQLDAVKSAAAAIKPITTERAMAAHPEFWAAISGDELSTE